MEAWDFIRNGPVALAGQWKFIWDEDRPEFSLPEFDDSSWETLPVQSFWNKTTGTGYGVGWLRVKIKVRETETLALYLKSSLTAYVMYANGSELMRNGSTGHSAADTIPQKLPLLADLPAAGTLVLAWKIANFHDANGGPETIPLLGNAQQLHTRIRFTDFIIQMMLGIILFMSVYHFILWGARPEDKSSFYFSLVCLMLFIYLFASQHTFSQVFPTLSVSLFEISSKLEYIGAMGCVSISFFFIHTLYPLAHHKISLAVYRVTFLLLSVFLIIFPLKIYSLFLTLFAVIYFIPAIDGLVSVFFAFLKKKEDAWIILLGILAIGVAAINDTLYSNQIIQTGNFFAYGILVFLFAESLVLTRQYVNNYRTVQHLSKNLQAEVDKKTLRLENQAKIMELQNNALQKTKLDLEETNRARTSFFINLAHETKTPLTLISNYLDQYIKNAGTSRELEIVKQNINKLTRDMLNFLDVQKLERGQIFYKHSDILDFSQLLESRIELFRATAARKEISITTVIPSGVCLKADPHAADRIINNLIDNAIRYTPRGGRVVVSLAEQADKLLFRVEDNGIGISCENQENIFNPFYQISGQKRNTQGIGMGLSIVKKIIETLNGTISVNSTLMQGSEFIVTLPKAEAVPGAAVSLSGRESLAVPDEGPWLYAPDVEPIQINPDFYNIMLVEDNIDLLHYLKDNLAGSYNVFTAANGKAALRELEKIDSLHLIIADVMMDEMDGLELCRHVMENEKYRTVPFIFLTAKSDPEEALEGLRLGAVDYICKPFNISELKTKIRSLLNLMELRNSFYEQERFAAIGKLTSGISHEILNPLTGIKTPLAYLEMVFEKGKYMDSSQKVAGAFSYINENITRIEAIIRSLKRLNYSQQADIERINLHEVTASIITLFKAGIKGRIRITVDIEEPCYILGNATGLTQILINLISNAIDAIEGEGSVRIYTEQNEQGTVICISDTGKGLKEGELDRIFDIHYSTKEPGKGSGFGLYIVKEIVSKMRWKLSVSSEPDKQTTFKLLIPDREEI